MLATLQIDLDNLWTIYRYHGIEFTKNEMELEKDAVYTISINRFLDILNRKNLKATFFVIGSSILNRECADEIKKAASLGHEIANHSFSHPLRLSSLEEKEIEYEIAKAEEIILQHIYPIQTQVLGFRAPLYDFNIKILRILEKMHYLYDASLLPIFKFRNINDLYNPDYNNPYKKGKMNIFEVPLSVFPFIKTPIHTSFIRLFRSSNLGFIYFNLGVRLNKVLNRSLHLLFHGIDLIDKFVDKRIPCWKWINTAIQKRVKEIDKMISIVSKQYKIVTVSEFVKHQ